MNDDKDLDAIVDAATSDIKAKSRPRNRAERRALAKKMGKKGRAQMDLITETAEKLNYIDLIQRLRELNVKKEMEDNGNGNR